MGRPFLRLPITITIVVGAGVPTGPHAGTNKRRVKDAAPYGGDGHSFDIQGAAARGCNEYEVLVASLVDKPIKFETSRAARHVLPTSTSPSAPNTPALRDVRRAEKIFSYTVHGAFFFISEKERGVHPPHRLPV